MNFLKMAKRLRTLGKFLIEVAGVAILVIQQLYANDGFRSAMDAFMGSIGRWQTS